MPWSRNNPQGCHKPNETCGKAVAPCCKVKTPNKTLHKCPISCCLLSCTSDRHRSCRLCLSAKNHALSIDFCMKVHVTRRGLSLRPIALSQLKMIVLSSWFARAAMFHLDIRQIIPCSTLRTGSYGQSPILRQFHICWFYHWGK